MVKMPLKGEVGGLALNGHGNYIVDHGKSWNCVFEFLWEPCLPYIVLGLQRSCPFQAVMMIWKHVSICLI